MISKLSSKLVATLINQETIDEGDRALYEYSLFILLSYIYFLIITVLAGVILHIPLQSLIFFISFSFLRQFAGGYHAKTEGRCLVITSSLAVSSMVITNISLFINSNIIIVLTAILSSMIIVVCSPLDTAEKPLEPYEKQKYKRVTAIIILILLAITIIAFILKKDVLYIPISVAILFESGLIVIGKMKNGSISEI